MNLVPMVLWGADRGVFLGSGTELVAEVLEGVGPANRGSVAGGLPSQGVGWSWSRGPVS